MSLEERQAQQLEAYSENKQRQYRSKQQRAADAQRKARIKELENEISELEDRASQLEAEISDPAIASDFTVMSAKCAELDDIRRLLDEKMEEWVEGQ